uniref:Uncharacterized protein n=1 Tax=Tanacetum cinerariifolium TaxID=118510 RepID=A0A699GHF9_TANCI|nr:hypothetical protein [Tanacetum cinerariifolium]
MAVEDDIVKTSDDTKIISSSSDLSLSFGDTLYLHPNDTGGSPIVSIKLTETDNYTMWSNILTREPLPSVKAAFAVVSGEESRRNVTSVRTTKPIATALQPRPLIIRGPNPNLKCTNCNKIRHIMDRCFELIGYPAGYVKRNFNDNTRPVSSNNASADVHVNSVSSNNATTSNSPVSLSNEQLARLMNFLNENGVSTANANMTVGNISLGWIVDSGANQHMIVSAKNLIHVVDILNLRLTVGHSNGTQALITKIGDLKINNDITLYDVLVVLEYTANKNVRIGKQLNGLYLFDVDNACKIVSNSCIASCFVSKTLWHKRLGHPADQVLNDLKTTLNLDSHSIFISSL